MLKLAYYLDGRMELMSVTDRLIYTPLGMKFGTTGLGNIGIDTGFRGGP